MWICPVLCSLVGTVVWDPQRAPAIDGVPIAFMSEEIRRTLFQERLCVRTDNEGSTGLINVVEERWQLFETVPAREGRLRGHVCSPGSSMLQPVDGGRKTCEGLANKIVLALMQGGRGRSLGTTFSGTVLKGGCCAPRSGAG